MLELLAPAGSMEALRAAVQNGANAVYLGCGSYNARQGAKNFTAQELVEAVKYCHIRGVAVHLTLNTLVSDREMEAVAALIRQGAEAGVDALIVQDLGVISLCRQMAPDIPLHGSTQMTVCSLAGVQLCAALGLKRVVLSRELSREEIGYICRNAPIEIEVFGHGALCMCYSGQCYLSAAIGGRSGNRGRCAQPCRQSYGYGRWEPKYPLSLKDNCLIDHLSELEALGVTSLKLEGRMKRPEYVAAVTGVYRQALDTGEVTPQMRQALSAAFNRQGFTDGYYQGQPGDHMFGIREEKNGEAPWMAAVRQTYEAAEHPLVGVRFAARFVPEGSFLTVTDPEGRSCTVRSSAPQPAKNHPLTEEELEQRLSKTGGTPYRCDGVRAKIASGAMVPAAQINAMRREALNQLTALRARREAPKLNRPQREPRYGGARNAPVLTCQVTSAEQITRNLLALKPALLYVPLHILAGDPALCKRLAGQVPVAAALPRIVHDGELGALTDALRIVRSLGVTGALVGNLGLLSVVREQGLALRGDFGLNLYNSRGVNLARQLELVSATLSFEMTLPQIRDVSKGVPCELLCYGRLPLMVTENCLFHGRTGQCTCQSGSIRLIDRTGAEFPVIRDGNSCRSVLLNGRKLSLLDRQEDLARLGLWATRLFFTTENPREVDRVLLQWQEPGGFDPACTRGLYLRGVE